MEKQHFSRKIFLRRVCTDLANRNPFIFDYSERDQHSDQSEETLPSDLQVATQF